MEALLRWTNDELGVVPPMDFIPIGEWVLRTALRPGQAMAR
jgi:sensor c-di-GMP phosphodiesterase-like protein